MDSEWEPRRGDVIWADFEVPSDEAGQDSAPIAGRRPVLVLSPQSYNAKTGLAVVCTASTAPRLYPFEVVMPDSLPMLSVAIADQVRTIDWRIRRAVLVGSVPPSTIREVLAKLGAVLDLHA